MSCSFPIIVFSVSLLALLFHKHKRYNYITLFVRTCLWYFFFDSVQGYSRISCNSICLSSTNNSRTVLHAVIMCKITDVSQEEGGAVDNRGKHSERKECVHAEKTEGCSNYARSIGNSIVPYIRFKPVVGIKS